MSMFSMTRARLSLNRVQGGDLSELGRALRGLLLPEDLTVVAGEPTSGVIEVAAYRSGPILRLDISLIAARVPVTDATTSGSYGTLKLLQLGEQGLCLLGSRANYTAFSPDGTGVPADTAFDIGIGSVAISEAADGALGGATDDDISGEKALTLSSGTAAGTVFTAGGPVFDGTTTAPSLNLNFSGSAATVDGDGYLDVTATFSVVFALLGDD